ncbi:hypothetical protein KJE23_09675, partial [Streptococcus salivarius]|nr:hypothetical protein [Streptococcus salivarius]
MLDLAVRAPEECLQASGITEGTIFRRLWKQRIDPALSPAAAGEVAQRRVASLPAIMHLPKHRAP